MINLPNLLTFIRIAMIPFMVFVFYLPFTWGHTVAACIFAIASCTDWLDGYLARSLKQSTKLGAFLDPVADKLMVSIALVLIVGEPQFQFLSLPSKVYSVPVAIITIPAAIIVGREIVVSALREWMAEIGKLTTMPGIQIAKLKTTVQMLSLVILLYCAPGANVFIAILGYLLLYFAAVLTIWSMILYLKTAWPVLRSQ